MTEEHGKYVIIYNGYTAPEYCKDCDFVHKKIAEFDTIDEVKIEWVKAVSQGILVEVFKRVYVKLEVIE